MKANIERKKLVEIINNTLIDVAYELSAGLSCTSCKYSSDKIVYPCNQCIKGVSIVCNWEEDSI
jgi:hypothetical protein